MGKSRNHTTPMATRASSPRRRRTINLMGAVFTLALLLLASWGSLHPAIGRAQQEVETATLAKVAALPTKTRMNTATATASATASATATPTVPATKTPAEVIPTLQPEDTTTPKGKPPAPTPTPRPSATPAPERTLPPPAATRQPQPTTLPKADKVVYLTFDDGPGAWTQPILDVLAKYDAHATFFVLGVQAAEWPDIIESIYEAGHGVANHTWKHVDLTTVSKSYFNAEVDDTADAITDAYLTKCLRPPYGARNQTVYDYAKDAGYTIALWSIDTGDWRLPGARAIAQNVLDNLHNQAVILMHDGGGDRSQTVAALEILLPQLQAMGYEMRAVCREDPMPQVGDYIVGIPSALEMGVSAPVEEVPEATTSPEVVETVEAGLVGDSVAAAPTPDAAVEGAASSDVPGAITFPQADAVVRGRVLVQGYVNTHAAAQGSVVLNWRLDLLDEDNSMQLGGGKPTDRVGALGIWDTRTIANGAHTLRLQLVYGDGSTEEQVVEVTVRN